MIFSSCFFITHITYEERVTLGNQRLRVIDNTVP